MSTTTVSAPQQAKKRSKVRADIQALRALAVLLVIANHLWPTRLTGGFVGVDVFFVISGFLITAHLLGEIRRTNRISLPQFYARRARRLLPAALLVGVVTLGATLIWLPAEWWSRIAREIFASAAYFENWMLTASSVNYSDRGQPSTPAQHYWSLSVEEQFYLLWPLTLLLLSWLLARRFSGRIAARPGLLAGAVIVLGGASLAFALWQTATNPAAAYFNTFGRVWEFMLGALVAIAAPVLAAWFVRRPMLAIRGLAQLTGYVMILVAAVRFDDATAFPGPWALLPVLGTTLVIAAGPDMPRWTPARLADWRPVKYVGDLSYSLYLWHWPIIVIMPFVLAREIRSVDRLTMLALSFALAILTKHFIEDPGRTKLFASARPRRTLLATLASVAVVGLLAGSTVAAAGSVAAREAERIEAAVGAGCFAAGALLPGNDCDDPFGPALFAAGADTEAPWGEAAASPECTTAASDRQILAAGKPSFVECAFGKSSDASGNRPYTVWLLGDSHAEHWKAAVNDIGRGNGWDVRHTMQGSCPSVPTALVQTFGKETSQEKRDNCASWITEVSERVLADAPDLVIVSNFASTEVVDDGTGRPQEEQLADGMQATLRAWSAAGTQVVVIRDVPTAGTTLGAECVATSGGGDRACVAPVGDVLRPDPMFAAANALDDPRIATVDMTEFFCRDGECSGVIGGLPVFFDADHVSASYSRSLAPMLGEALSDAIGVSFHAPVSSPQ